VSRRRPWDPMAASATLHCLTGCSIGEIVGMLIGTAAGLSNAVVVVISIALAFVFGFTLSSLPLLDAGLDVGAALRLVLAADTLSIATMEVVDNLTMVVIPGAMDAGLVNAVFWLSMAASLVVAFAAAYPVNRWLMARGKGHALTHGFHGGHGDHEGDPAPDAASRRHIPVPASTTLAALIAAFMLGGLVVSLADDLAGGAAAGMLAPCCRRSRSSLDADR